jgi:tellurite resistance-related uncharacterized protein
MIRSIVGFHQDAEGDWVAELSCFHNQHVRHRPPFQPREWVLDPAGRSARIGAAVSCPLCDRAEMPTGLVLSGHAGPWNEGTLPGALRRAHCTPPGQWGLLQVLGGSVDFQFRPDEASPGEILHLEQMSQQPIPPEVAHRVIVVGPARLELELWELPKA